jgi:hypothetical protein
MKTVSRRHADHEEAAKIIVEGRRPAWTKTAVAISPEVRLHMTVFFYYQIGQTGLKGLIEKTSIAN